MPGKALKDLFGKTVLQHIVERVNATKGIDKVVIAMTDQTYDDPLEKYVKDLGVEYFRGSENDVLDRFYQCAKKYNPEIVVRVTADDPLKDPEVIEKALNCLVEDKNLDYCSNTLVPSYPEGLDIEAFRFSALKTAWEKAQLPSEREHVTPFIWKNPGLFNLTNIKFDRDLSHWRWTLDKENDYELIYKIYEALYQPGKIFSYIDAIKLVEKNIHWLSINSNTVRNEGYLKSLAQENTHG